MPIEQTRVAPKPKASVLGAAPKIASPVPVPVTPAPAPVADPPTSSGGGAGLVPMPGRAAPGPSAQATQAAEPSSYSLPVLGASQPPPVADGPMPNAGPVSDVTLQKQKDEEERAAREALLGTGGGKAKPMSLEEYNGLSDRQRAAVDFNTLLNKAVKKDVKAEYTPNDEQRMKYDSAVESMFGKDGGSDIYAPQTMAVLRQIEFKDTSSDLDDFLGLKMVLDESDLPNLEGNQVMPTSNPLAELQGRLADGTRAMQQQVATGNQLLQTLPAMTKQDRVYDLQQMGAPVTDVKMRTGYGPGGSADEPNMNDQFRYGFELLAQKPNSGNIAEMLGTFKTKLGDEQYNKFLSYVGTRTQMSSQFGLPLGTGVNGDGSPLEYTSPDEFRKLLGMNKGATDAR